MANSADPDQLASSEANWSGSTLFAKARYIRVQQDKGYYSDTLTHYQSYPKLWTSSSDYLVMSKKLW